LGRRASPPRRTLLLRHRSYGLMRRSPLALLSFGHSLVRKALAGYYQPLLPAGSSRRYLCESFLGCLVPCHGGPTECTYLFLPPCLRPSPTGVWVGFPLSPANTTLRGAFFEAADISSLCSGLRVCSPPRSFLPLRVQPQGSRGFYVRAYRASLPPLAPDMLVARIQAIGDTGTFTPQDPQPCRLLPPVYASLGASRYPAQNSGPSGSLPLSRETLAFSASCRFIPAHEFPFSPEVLQIG